MVLFFGLACGRMAPAPAPNNPITMEVTATPQAASSIVITEVNWYTLSNDSLWFIGEVENTGAVTLDLVRVDMVLRDAQGEVIAEDFGFAEADPLLAGAKLPFVVLFEDGVDGWATYEMVAEAEPDRLDRYYGGVSIESVTEIDDTFLDFELQGEVINTGSEAARFIQVVGSFYDTAGRLVAVEGTFADSDSLAPGDTAPFTMFVNGTAGEIATYELQVLASPVD